MRYLIALSLFGQFVLATELPLATPPIGPAPYYRNWAGAASNGRGFLVVSNESRVRNGAFAMRADATGHPIDRVMMRVPESDASVSPVAVASDGDSYLVAYFAGGDSSLIVHLARVDDRGVVTIGESIASRGAVSLAWGGSNYIVSYYDPVSDVMDAAVVSSDGRVLRKDVALVRGAVYQTSVHVSPATVGSVMVTATGKDGRLYANLARTDLLLDGTYFAPVVDPTSTALVGPLTAVSAASGDEILVVWAVAVIPVQPVGTYSQIRARRIANDGTPLGDVFDVASVAGTTPNLAAAWNGSDFLVAYAGLSNSAGAVVSISSDSQVKHLADIGVSSETATPVLALAGRPGGALLIWNDAQLNGSFITTTASEPRLFDPSSAAQDDPAIAFCGSEYRAVWGERSNRSRIVFARADARGVPLDSAAAPIVGSDRWQSQPNIACNASNALVTWNERDLTGRNITAHAALVDPDGTAHQSLDLGPAPASPSVAWDGTSYLIAWQDAESHEIHLARIDQEGQPVVARVMRNARGTLGDASPSIAWNGSEYLIAWSEETLTVHPQNYADPQTLHTIDVVRLSRELTQLGATREVSVRADASGADAAAPLAIAGENGWLVAWRQRASFYPFTYSEYYVTLARNLEDATPPVLLGDPEFNPLVADGWFIGGVYRLAFGPTLVSISGLTSVTSGLEDVAAVSHGGSLVVHRHVSDELLPRLYLSADGRMRPGRH